MSTFIANSLFIIIIIIVSKHVIVNTPGGGGGCHMIACEVHPRRTLCFCYTESESVV